MRSGRIGRASDMKICALLVLLMIPVGSAAGQDPPAPPIRLEADAIVIDLGQEDGRPGALTVEQLVLLCGEISGRVFTYDDETANLLRTILEVEHLEARQLTTSLRPLLPDAAVESMHSAGNSPALVLTGVAGSLIQTARTIEAVDAIEGGREGGAPAAAAETPGAGSDESGRDGEHDHFVLDVREGPSLFELARICEQTTDRRFLCDPSTARFLRSCAPRLTGPVTVPAQELYPVFQGMLITNGLVCFPVGPPEQGWTQIQVIHTNEGRSNIQANAVYVPAEELADYADQPAILIRTVITLENTDARQLSTSLRPLLPDASSQSMLNAGNSRSLVLIGTGAEIANLAELLHFADEVSAFRSPPQLEVTEPSEN